MRFTDHRSIIIISVYILVNFGIISLSVGQNIAELQGTRKPRPLLPEYTVIEHLDYFHLKNGVPQMSLAADRMKSMGEVEAEFASPRGVYNYQKKNESLRYQAHVGLYKKNKDLLQLKGEVKIKSEKAEYFADILDYFFKNDLIIASGEIKFTGEDTNTRDSFVVESAAMRANPQQKLGRFTGGVKGSMERKKKYEGKMRFSSQELELDHLKSLAHLEGDVYLERGNYKITAGKADIYFENFNKNLKYFVLNDDVKVTETLNTPQGVTERKAFSERLEGFGREQKMILSGAPKVEQGLDVIKGYRITIRENADLVEVDDAMSDVKVKRKEKLKD